MNVTLHASSLALLLLIGAPACNHVAVDEGPPGPVSGTVLDAAGGPAPGVLVRIADKVTTTDAAGHFAFVEANGAYDADLVPPGGLQPQTYLGLRSHQPTLRLTNTYLSPDLRHSTVTVTLPTADTDTLKASVVVEVKDNLSSLIESIANSSSPSVRSTGLGWRGDKMLSVRIHALQFTADPLTQAPTGYVGYDAIDLQVLSGAESPWTPTWHAPSFPSSTVSFVPTLPEGYTIWQQEVSMRQAGPGFTFPIAWSVAKDAQTFLVPALPGASFSLSIYAGDAGGSSGRFVPDITAGGPPVSVVVDTAPSLSAPAAGEAFGVGSEVTWDAGGEGVTFVIITPDSPGTLPTYTLFGGEGIATMPDLSALGVPFPHGAKYSLGVFRDSSHPTVDDLANNPAPGEPSTYAYTPYRSITMQ